MLKLIACDLDGTLLLDGAQTLQKNTCHLIHRLREEKGILFVPASGRQYRNIRNLFSPVADEIAYICENGCLTFYQGQMLHKEFLDRETGVEILKDIAEREGEEILLSGMDTSYVMPKNPDFVRHMREVVGNHVTVVEDILDTPEPYYKIAVCAYGGDIKDCQDYYLKTYGEELTVATSGNIWLDLNKKGACKRSGLKALIEKLDIAPEECMAIGDNFNDAEMLSFVGHPVTMATAVPGVYEMSDRHTDTVEHLLESLL